MKNACPRTEEGKGRHVCCVSLLFDGLEPRGSLSLFALSQSSDPQPTEKSAVISPDRELFRPSVYKQTCEHFKLAPLREHLRHAQHAIMT